MNRICHTVWNNSTQSWVATSELAKGHTKGNGSTKKTLLATTLLTLLSTQLISPAMAFTSTVTNQTVTDEVLNTGDHQFVETGGIANNIIINGGKQTVGPNGTVNGSIISNEGEQWVQSVANDTIINVNGKQVVFEGGITTGSIVNAGGYQDLYDGGVANHTTVHSGGNQYISVNGIANNTTINGGTQSVFGTANDTVIDNIGGLQEVYQGGVANNTTVTNNANQTVYGTANDTALYDNGSQTVANDGIANNTTINDNGWQTIVDNGTANNTTINSGGFQVLINGTANNTTINADGAQDVHAGAVANSTTINSDGYQYVDVGGVANNTTINGGTQSVFGTANDTLIDNLGVQTVYQGGVANNTTVTNNANQTVYGTANDTTLYDYGSQTVINDGIANNTTINNNGWQTIVDNGTTNNTTINSGGFQVLLNGTANNTTINTDGTQNVHAGAVANNTTINSDGHQFVDAGATVNNTLINGGYQFFYGTSNNTVANAGEIYAGTGSILDGTTQINGTATIGGALITNLGTLVFNPGAQTTVSTEITGSGDLTKAGEGTLVLNNTHTYTGGTSVSGGRLIVGGTAADSSANIQGTVDVLNGGILGGHGKIAGPVTVHTGGKVNPGNSIGTLTVGSAHFMSGSTFEVSVNPDGTNDKLIASNTMGSGTVQIDNGANLLLLGGAGVWNDTTRYTLIDTDSGVTGTFTNVNSNLAFLTPTVDYSNPNQVNLTMERNQTSFASIGGTFNEINTGFGIESLGSNNPIYQQIISMNFAQAHNAYNNLSGEIHGSVKSALLENSRYPRHAILEHLDRTATQGIPETDRNLWVNTWAHDGHLKDDGNATRLDNKGAGFIAGADLYQNDVTTIGAALGYEQSDLKVGDLRNSDADTKAIHIMAYGQTELGLVDLKAGIGYSWINVDSKRHVAVGNMVSQNSAKYDAGLVQIFTEGSHTFEINEQARVAPYVGLLYQHISTDGFTENGAIGQLQGRSSSDHSTNTTLGVRGKWEMNSNSNLYANVGWQHSFGDRAPESTLNFIGGASYNVKGVQTNRDSALIGLGASFDLRPNMSLNVGYDGKFGNQSTDHGAKVGLNFVF